MSRKSFKVWIIGLAALVVFVSGCTFPGAYVFPGEETSANVCRGWSCGWTDSNRVLSCTRSPACTGLAKLWTADTGISGTGDLICPGDEPCYCTGYSVNTIAPQGYGSYFRTCTFKPAGTCFTSTGKLGTVVSGSDLIIGCQFINVVGADATSITIDLTGQLTPEPEPEPGEYCGDNICQSTETCNDCPVDCGTCEGPIPEPPPPTDIWSAFIGVFQGLWNWFVGLLSPGQLVTSGETAVAGDDFKHTFTLTNTRNVVLPDTYYQDGDRSWLYYGYAVFDPSGKIIDSDLTEITQSVDPNGIMILPVSYAVEESDPSGQYTVISTMLSVTSVWNSASNMWIEGQPVTIDKKAVSFNVQAIAPPPSPTVDVSQWFTDLFAGIQDWLCTNLGVFC